MTRTLSIIVNRVGTYSERFVERHIRESFGGRTVVVARHAGGEHDFAQPLLETDGLRAAGLGARAAASVGGLRAYLQHGYPGVPTGELRERIAAFWAQHRTAAVLAEFGPLGCWIAPVARACELPVFVYFRGYDASSKLRSVGTARAYRHLMAQVDGVFAVSAFLVENLRRAGVEHVNTHVIPSGTNPRRFMPGDKDDNLLVTVGRLIPKKRPQATVRAFAAASARHPELRLELVGDGPLQAECEALARSLGVADRVHFLGRRDHRFVADLLSRARIYLQHSVTAPSGETEGLPSSIQEAMAAGAVVVSTRHAGIPEVVIEGQTGWLVEEGDEAGYAHALERALGDPPRLARMAQQARELACERLDTARLQQRMEAVILAAAPALREDARQEQPA